ncbi:hypothetical protein HWD28_gp081 [Salmonella phage atrejo]|uniref:HNH nuclease domain-containing protein n=1 Tax=Salmonella phage atrejo TaxID=2713277 RepID=A0A6G8RK48_9CAUD|nr:hypothetical protein HWD28_gp081 [Salmonella phage atrejo]QIO01729.1 hypothetical protein atrejo_81 [Salmonella phage atrejo]
MGKLIYPPKEELEKVFFVDDSTGILMRRLKSGKVKRAGSATSSGYVQVSFKGTYYYAHIISFIMDRGYQPENIVDHEDGNTLNNRPGNLREATHTQNSCNTRLRKDNSSGYKGVYKNGTYWQVKTTIAGKCYSKSGFNSPEEANEYAVKLRESLHGEFARHE